MKIAVLGTGMVGRAHAAKLRSLGHEVVLGTREPRRESGTARSGSAAQEFTDWHSGHSDIVVDTFAGAATGAELVMLAVNGRNTVPVVQGLVEQLAGTVVVDITNPLDFSTGELQLFVCNTDSLGEQVQRAAPRARVVKTLCTVTADVQTSPDRLSGGDHAMFLAGNDEDAKAVVSRLLTEYGWRRVIDLGDIVGARGMEMMLPMWLRLMNTLGTAQFNYRVVTADPT